MKLWKLFGRSARITDFRGCAALIVSGDQRFLDYYRNLIVSLGMTPVTAQSPDSALAILRMTSVALVIADQAQSSGCRRFLEGLRRVSKRPAVLVVSPESNSFARLEALELGAAECVNHPAVRDDLVHALIPG